MGEVTVVARGPGWLGYCTQHGPLPTTWAFPYLAAFDALGHATTHHRKGLPSPPCTD